MALALINAIEDKILIEPVFSITDSDEDKTALLRFKKEFLEFLEIKKRAETDEQLKDMLDALYVTNQLTKKK